MFMEILILKEKKYSKYQTKKATKKVYIIK